jgi:hypothetical protein
MVKGKNVGLNWVKASFTLALMVFNQTFIFILIKESPPQGWDKVPVRIFIGI